MEKHILEIDMTRIRYKMNKFEVLVSPEFLAFNKIVFAEIYHDFHANIYEKGKVLPLLRLESNNMQNLKKLVKKTLIEYGVLFTSEVRPRFEKNAEEMKKALQDSVIFGTGKVKLEYDKVTHVPYGSDEFQEDDVQ
jgi:hypothetical protein